MAPPEEVLGRKDSIGFADFAPIHIVGLASVRKLNGLVKEEVPRLSALRFRPNIIVKGTPAYDEDDWKNVKIGTDNYYVIARTPRCKVPNNDPDTGERNRNEPDVTMRRERNIDPGAPNKGCMGMHMFSSKKDGEVKVGDEIVVEERTELHRWGQNLWTGET